MARILWTNAISGSFNDGVNWANGVVPGARDYAILVASGPAYTVTVASTADVRYFRTNSNVTLALTGNIVFKSTNGGENAGTIVVGENTGFYIASTLSNTGTVNIDGSIQAGMTLIANTTLTGRGSVTMENDGNNYISSLSPSNIMTNLDNTISGAGLIATGLINQAAGVIDATGTNTLFVSPSAGQPIANAGLLEGTGSGGITISNAAVDGLGGTIFAGAGSSVTLASTTVNGAGGNNVLATALGGVINIGGPAASGISIANAEGTLSNAGTIALASFVNNADLSVLSAGATLSGGGNVTLAGPNSRIYGASSAATLTNIDNKITGAGQLGDGSLTLVNRPNGVIDATGPTALVINTGANTIANAGTIEAARSGQAIINSAVANSGVLATVGGRLIVNGAVSGTGVASINGGTLDFTSTFNENVTFPSGAGLLILSQSQSYSGRVSGFSFSGHTSLDLRDIGFVGAGEATFSGNATSGVLTVTDGTHTAHLTLVGNYTGSKFTAKSDGHGGTIVVDPSAASISTHPMIAAMATMGGRGGGLEHLGAFTSRAPSMLAAPHTQIA